VRTTILNHKPGYKKITVYDNKRKKDFIKKASSTTDLFLAVEESIKKFKGLYS